jgi:hypothetical protein
MARAYSPAVEQWRPAVESVCVDQGCVDRIMWLISCESGGNPNATHPNPNGGTDVGLLQINDLTWGSVAYADGATQIEWTAEHLGSVWWACG